MQEIEIKYLLSLSALPEQVDLDALPKERMLQSYFTPAKIRSVLLPELIKRLPAGSVNEALEYNNGRVRSIKRDGKASYTLTVKGPRTDFYSRLELEIEIEPELFATLEPQADEGSVEKTRHFLDGFLEFNGQQSISAEIDLMHMAGRHPVQMPGIPEFALVEIEVPDREWVTAIQAGLHSFGFLKAAKEIGKLPVEMQRIMRMRYFAQHGMDQAVVQVLRTAL